MLTKLTALFLLFSFNCHAVTLRVVGKDGAELFSAESKSEKQEATVGDLTVAVFDQFEIAFEGGSFGISKMFGLAGDLEVISETEMKAYGWCFSVDGVTPNTMADHTAVARPESVIEWYYAYAHYKDGAWVGQCLRRSPIERPQT